MQVQSKDTWKPQQNFRRVSIITKLEYSLHPMRHSDCNHSDSTRRIVMKFNILLFMETLWRKKILLKSDKHVGYFLKGMPHLSKYLVGSSEIKNVSNKLC